MSELPNLCNPFDRKVYDTHDWCLTHNVAVPVDGPCPVTTEVVEQIVGDRLAAVRAYVDDPGNWSALDGRRQVLLDMLEGKR